MWSQEALEVCSAAMEAMAVAMKDKDAELAELTHQLQQAILHLYSILYYRTYILHLYSLLLST